MAQGEELLIIDADARALSGMTRMFTDDGYVVTSLEDGDRAIALASQKFFPVVLLDFQLANKTGIEVLVALRRHSPQTRVIFLSREPDAALSIEAFRKGAFDIIKKDRLQVAYLKERVNIACHVFRGGSGGSQMLLKETKQILEELVTTMIDIAKRNLLLEGTESIVAAAKMSILVADDSADFARLLSSKPTFNITHCHSASEALDQLTQQRYDLVVAKETLPDLPGSMVLKQAQGQSTETQGFRLDLFSGSQARLTPFQRGRESGSAEQFMNPIVLLKRFEELQERKSEIARERRAVESVTRRNFQLFKRYGEIRDRLANAIEASDR